MKKNRIPGLKRYREPKTGKIYCYHRKSSIRLKEAFGSPEFFEEIARIERKTNDSAALPGTLGHLFIAYRASPAFTGLAVSTRKSYHWIMDILKPIQGMPLVDLTTVMVANLRDSMTQERGPRTANYVMAVISVASEFGRERGIVQNNPVRGLKRAKKVSSDLKANRSWTVEERHSVLTRAPSGLRVPVALAMFTGLRKGDVLTLQKSAISDGNIRVMTGKTKRRLVLPIHPDLLAILSASDAHEAATVAATSRGTPWTISGFNASFCSFIDKLEKEGLVGPGLTFHGLRHTVGTVLVEAGGSIDLVRRILGQRTLSMAQHYSEEANTAAAAQDLMTNFDPLRTRK